MSRAENRTGAYHPHNPFLRWLEKRLPIGQLFYSEFVAYPTPRNLNYWWAFGAILTFMLGAQLATGIVLAMHYTPHADLAFRSVEQIMRDVDYGWLLRYLHSNGASMFFVAVYVHMFRSLYYGSYKEPYELVWILGVIVYLLMVVTGFLGYVLVWGQMSFWAATVITNLFSAIPVVGDSIVNWLWGGYAVGNPTLNRFYSLHYLLPFMIIGVAVVHVWALHVSGQNNPAGIPLRIGRDTVPFTPYATVKDVFATTCFLILYAWFVFYIPNYLGHSDNYIPANPAVTPTHIVPEWYYLPFYAILRAIPDKLMGVIALAASILILAFLPWLDTSKVRSARYRPLFKQFFWLFVIVCIGLGWLGSKPPEGIYVILARIFTVYYFAFFLLILPLLGIFEKTKPVPKSISESVLDAKACAGEIRAVLERPMDKPRIFLGSSAQQEKLLQALTRGLSDIAHVEPWMTSFTPGTSALERLVELTREVDFAAFVFAQDDWTTSSAPASSQAGQASPRDNVVFEAGLFGGTLGMRRTFILHAHGAKLPSDLLGLTCVRYDAALTPSELKIINQKIRTAIENEGRVTRVEGSWWQFSLTERTAKEPSALSLLKISRARNGALELTGRSWREDGSLSARYWSEAVKEREGSPGIFYYWKGERPLDPNAPQLDGVGEIKLESPDRASGYFTTRADADPNLNARTAGVYWRADHNDINILDDRDDQKRAALIAQRLTQWKSVRNS